MYDMSVKKTVVSIVIPFSVIDADDIFADQDDWTYTVTLANWDNTKSSDLSVNPTVNYTADNVTVNATYAETLAVLGLRDPGTYTLYASRPDLDEPGVTEIVELYAANIGIQLASPVDTIYQP